AYLRVRVGAVELAADLDSVSSSDKNLLQPGSALSASVYQQQITAIDVDGHRWLSSANPAVAESRDGMVALLMLGLGTLGLVMAASIMLLLACSFGLRWLYVRTARMFVDDFNVGQSGLFVSSRTVPRSEVARIFICAMTQPRGPVFRRVLALGRNGDALVRVTGEDFSMDDVTAVAHDLGVPIEGSW